MTLLDGAIYRHNHHFYACRRSADGPSVMALHRCPVALVHGALVHIKTHMIAGSVLSYVLSREYAGCWYAVVLLANGQERIQGGAILDFESDVLPHFVKVADSVKQFVREMNHG